MSISQLCNFGQTCGICASNGTEFRKAVFHVVANIPPGKVLTYGAVAQAIGRPRASRAVGNSLKSNPFNFESASPRVPCHRVIGKNDLGGFYGRQKIPRKVELLHNEGVLLDGGNVHPDYIMHSFDDLGSSSG